MVTMPEWFEALNRDFRYQLTVIGTFAQAIVANEVKGSPLHDQNEQTQGERFRGRSPVFGAMPLRGSTRWWSRRTRPRRIEGAI